MELIVVLVLMGALLTIVTPAFTRLSETPSGATAVIRALEAARATSLSQAAQVDVIIDPMTARIWIRGERTTPRLDTTYVLSLPASDSLVSQTRRVRFSFAADGSAWGDSLVVRSEASSHRIDVATLDRSADVSSLRQAIPQ